MDKLDFSLGDPLLPLRSVANHAFREAAKDLNRYHVIAHAYKIPEITKILSSISAYFTARGIQDPNYTRLGLQDILVTGGGTTEGFAHIINFLARDVKKRQDVGEPIKPVIVMPTPTYGYFAEYAKKQGFETITIPRDSNNNWHLNPDDIIAGIRKIHEDGKRVIAWYDSNPNNPTGLIRGREETLQIAEILTALSRVYEDQDMAWRKKQKFSHGTTHTTRVKIIDDMVYDGLEYEGREQPFAFAQLQDFHTHIFPDTFTLFGPSKAGLVGLRAGLLIAHHDLLKFIQYGQMETSYFASGPAYHACQAYFNKQSKFLNARNKHLKTLNRKHATRGLLMKALINGMNTMPELNESLKNKLIAIVAKETGTSKTKAKTRLQRGIPPFKITTTPQSGFFHLIDFAPLKNLAYDSYEIIQHDRKYYDRNEFGIRNIEDGHTVSHMLESVSLAFTQSSWMEMDKDSVVFRVTFAKPYAEILAMADRLQIMAKTLRPIPLAANPPVAAIA